MLWQLGHFRLLAGFLDDWSVLWFSILEGYLPHGWCVLWSSTWEGYLPHDWSVLWFSTWEGYLTYDWSVLWFSIREGYLPHDWSVFWFNIWEWLVCSLIQYLGMTGLFFDSVFGNDWSVIWFSIWEGYLPHPVGRVLTHNWSVLSVFGTGTYHTLWEGYLGRLLTPPCVGTSTAFQSSVWYCYCPSYCARSSCAGPDLSRHVMAIHRVYCRSPDRTAKCASYKSAQKSASEAESDLHV